MIRKSPILSMDSLSLRFKVLGVQKQLNHVQKLGEAEEVAEMERAGAQCKGAMRRWLAPPAHKVSRNEEAVHATGQVHVSREQPQSCMGCTIQG